MPMNTHHNRRINLDRMTVKYMSVDEDVLALIDIARAARKLYEEVEMGESVGVCLDDRVPSMVLGDLLAKLDG